MDKKQTSTNDLMGNTVVTILVVDDDEQMQTMLKEILEEQGFTVKCAGNGKQAIKASEEELFNLALIDIHLPDMEGTELLSKLRKTEPPIIKIIVTGHATLDNSIEAANRGVDGYFTKPFDAEKLIFMIRTQLKKQKKNLEFDEKKVAEYIHSRHQWMNAISKSG